MAYLTCNKLVLGYDNKPVTTSISFEVNKGDYLCIFGENGAGKSTLIKTILGLIEPIRGKVVMGEDLKPYEIGYLPQQTTVQRDFPSTVWEIVLSGTLASCGIRPFYTKKEKDLALSNIKKMGIEDLKNKCYRQLSGGQQQRVLLARALCATSKIILLDEPVTGLDPKAGSDLYRLIEELNKEGVTVIMVSHDIKGVMDYPSHILHFTKDSCFFGTRQEYLSTYKNKEAEQ